MKKLKKRNKTALVISVIAIIVTLVVLSDVVNALALQEITTTRQLAEFAAMAIDPENPEGPPPFIAANPGQIFAINAANNQRGMEVGKFDWHYKSTICVYHTQADTVDDSNLVLVSNIVDIEAPGDVIVYKYESIEKISSGEIGTITEEGNTITEIASRIENGVEQKYEVKYTKTVLNLSDVERENFEKIAYLMDRAIEIGPDISEDNPEFATKYTIDWYWKTHIKNYISARRVLDESFDLETYPNYQEYYYSLTEMGLAEDAAANILQVSLTRGETIPQIYYPEDGKAYIGPLQINYTGGTTSLKVQGNSGEISANWTTMNEDGTFNEEISDNIISDQIFYAVVDASEINGRGNVEVKAYLNYTKGYKARFALANNKTEGGQNLMFFTGTEDNEEGQEEVSWNVEQDDIKLTIKKQDADGGALEAQGIKFEVYDSNGDSVGELTTTASGTTTTLTGLEKDQIYTIKEVVNATYGYKNRSMIGADIISGTGTIISSSVDEVTFKLESDTTIAIKNKPELGRIIINKTDEMTGQPLEGVRFVIYKHNGFIKIDGVTSPYETTDEGLDISQCTVTYVGDIKEATEFKTNSSGKIVINNLEIYSGPNEKYKYRIYETSNEHYGYKQEGIIIE